MWLKMDGDAGDTEASVMVYFLGIGLYITKKRFGRESLTRLAGDRSATASLSQGAALLSCSLWCFGLQYSFVWCEA